MSADNGQPGGGPTTTIPASDGKGSGLDPTELQAIAAQLGESPQNMASIIATQGKLSSYANSIKSSPMFVDFMFTADHSGAVVLVEPGTDAGRMLADTAAPAGVEVQKAVATRAARLQSLADVQAAVGALQNGAVVGVTYDAFTNEDTVWVAQGKAGAPTTDQLARSTTKGRSAIGASLRIGVAQTGGLFRGGQNAQSSLGEGCTTGFGVISGSTGAYETAGHCGLGTWTINGNKSTSVQSRVFGGGYYDHEMIVAPGASWLVRIDSLNTQVDMEATPYHIYLNGLYCSYGSYSNIESCGYINAQNVPVSDGTTTIYTSQSSARCRPGDSGGPVWGPTASRQPSGTIEGGDVAAGPDSNGNYACRYVALDDQLRGSGWSLL